MDIRNSSEYGVSVDICDSGFSRIEDAKFLSEVSASYGKSKLWMHNFAGEYLQVMGRANLGCTISMRSILTLSKMWNADAKFAKEVSSNTRKGKMQMRLYIIGRLKSICKFKEKQVADTLVPKRASATENIKPVQIQQLPQKSICNSEYQGIADTSATRKVNPSSLYLFQSRYITKQEKDYAIQRIGVGLARRS